MRNVGIVPGGFAGGRSAVNLVAWLWALPGMCVAHGISKSNSNPYEHPTALGSILNQRAYGHLCCTFPVDRVRGAQPKVLTADHLATLRAADAHDRWLWKLDTPCFHSLTYAESAVGSKDVEGVRRWQCCSCSCCCCLFRCWICRCRCSRAKRSARRASK